MQQTQNLIAEQAKIFKALGHPSRLLMVDALMHQSELCVCDLQAIAGGDMSTVSKHLSVLKGAGIVYDTKRGLNVYYALRLPCLKSFLRCTADAVQGRTLGDMRPPKT